MGCASSREVANDSDYSRRSKPNCALAPPDWHNSPALSTQFSDCESTVAPYSRDLSFGDELDISDIRRICQDIGDGLFMNSSSQAALEGKLAARFRRAASDTQSSTVENFNFQEQRSFRDSGTETPTPTSESHPTKYDNNAHGFVEPLRNKTKCERSAERKLLESPSCSQRNCSDSPPPKRRKSSMTFPQGNEISTRRLPQHENMLETMPSIPNHECYLRQTGSVDSVSGTICKLEVLPTFEPGTEDIRSITVEPWYHDVHREVAELRLRAAISTESRALGRLCTGNGLFLVRPATNGGFCISVIFVGHKEPKVFHNRISSNDGWYSCVSLGNRSTRFRSLRGLLNHHHQHLCRPRDVEGSIGISAYVSSS